jgi:hypothetical protein
MAAPAAPGYPTAHRDSAEVRVLHRAELARIDVLFGNVRPNTETFRDQDWDRRVTVWWTEGKDKHWEGLLGMGPSVIGTVPVDRVRVWESLRLLEGEILIDIAALETLSTFTEKGVSSIPYAMYRNQAFNTLCHELLHVVQVWVEGNFGFSARYAREWAHGQFSVSEDRTSLFDWHRGWQHNVLERSAMNYGNLMRGTHAEALSDGKFDDLLPVERLRLRAEEWATRNPGRAGVKPQR